MFLFYDTHPCFIGSRVVVTQNIEVYFAIVVNIFININKYPDIFDI